MRSSDAMRRDALRMVLAAVQRAEKEGKHRLADDEMLGVLAKRARRSATSLLDTFRAGGREDLVAKEEAAIAVVSEFMPQPLSEAELRTMVEPGHRRDRRRIAARHGQGDGLALAPNPRPRRRQGRQPARVAAPGSARRRIVTVPDVLREPHERPAPFGQARRDPACRRRASDRPGAGRRRRAAIWRLRTRAMPREQSRGLRSRPSRRHHPEPRRDQAARDAAAAAVEPSYDYTPAERSRSPPSRWRSSSSISSRSTPRLRRPSAR